MADFCNICASNMGIQEDFNIEEIFEELTEGYYMSVLCEKCSLSIIRKKDGKMLLLPFLENRLINPSNTEAMNWLSFENYFDTYGNEPCSK